MSKLERRGEKKRDTRPKGDAFSSTVSLVLVKLIAFYLILDGVEMNRVNRSKLQLCSSFHKMEAESWLINAYTTQTVSMTFLL